MTVNPQRATPESCLSPPSLLADPRFSRLSTAQQSISNDRFLAVSLAKRLSGFDPNWASSCED
jgi:hypothetical protein